VLHMAPAQGAKGLTQGRRFHVSLPLPRASASALPLAAVNSPVDPIIPGHLN